MSEWVLVVDDNEAIRDCLADVLEGMGCKSVTARDGQEALTMLRATPSPPAFILLDLMMPRMNGWQVLERRSKDATLAKVPVLVMTAVKDQMVEGFDVMGVLEKPIAYETLQHYVDKVGVSAA